MLDPSCQCEDHGRILEQLEQNVYTFLKKAAYAA